MDLSRIDFKKMNGAVPVIAQDSETNEILMVAYTNQATLKLTLSIHYYN